MICNCIQEVSDLGRGRTVAVLPEILKILKSIIVCVFRYIIDILVQVVCKHFKDEIGNDPIVFLDSNRKETTHC